MKIAVNTRLLIKNKLDGIAWFSYETLRRICRDHPEHEFIFLFDRKYDPSFIFEPNVKPIVIGPPARHPFLWFIWFEFSVKRALRKERADIFISPDGYLSLGSKVPSIAVIHDINFYHRPKDLPFFSRIYYNYFFPLFARRKSKRIGTVSEYSKNDITIAYKIKKGLIDVLYNGVNESYTPLENKIKDNVREVWTNGVPYFIFIGTMHPRKNIPGLLKSYDLFRKSYHDEFLLKSYDLFRKSYHDEFRLIIVGEKMFMTKEIDQVFSEMKFKDEVIFTGRLEPKSLHEVLAAATAMVFVPYFEGFGIPLLEAMKCGVPVIASNTTSLPEVAGVAALLCSPDDIQSIADYMNDVASDSKLRKELIKKGLLRADQFSWDISAKRFWDLIEKVIKDA